MAYKTVTVVIKQRYKDFIELVDKSRTVSWGDLFVESLKYNPKYNHLFLISEDKYNYNIYKKSDSYDLKEIEEVKKIRKKINEVFNEN